MPDSVGSLDTCLLRPAACLNAPTTHQTRHHHHQGHSQSIKCFITAWHTPALLVRRWCPASLRLLTRLSSSGMSIVVTAITVCCFSSTSRSCDVAACVLCGDVCVL